MKISGFTEDHRAKTKAYFAKSKNVSLNNELIEKIETELKKNKESSIRFSERASSNVR